MAVIQVATSRGHRINADVDTFPDECPVCHHYVHPEQIGVSLKHPATRRELEIAFRCTRDACQAMFIGYYKGNLVAAAISEQEPYDLKRTAPFVPLGQNFSEEIKALSPMFVTVYNQALAAEAAGLDQLTAIGLRKALEFLVKDLTISFKPAAKDDILKSRLGLCIANYIDDANLKECARRAAWLGNDETHHLRKWDDKDITDLKLLVRLTVNWAENVILAKRYIDEMPSNAN